MNLLPNTEEKRDEYYTSFFDLAFNITIMGNVIFLSNPTNLHTVHVYTIWSLHQICGDYLHTKLFLIFLSFAIIPTKS